MSSSELLIRAQVCASELAVEAWREWSRSRDLDTLEDAELRHLPLIYRRLIDGGIPESEIAPIVKTMYRSTWIRTRMLLHEVAAAVDLLSANGVEALLLKGAAMVAGYYRDAGVRPMSDFDLLVHPRNAIVAASLLERAGWRASPRVDETSVTFLHAAVLKKGESACDLHWWALWDSRDAAADERFWSGAEQVTLDRLSSRVLRPEHQVLHLIVHGSRRVAPALRWISDTMAVLRARAETFDWSLLVAEAEARGVQYPVGDALAYLAERFDAAIPGDVIAALQASHVARFRRSLYVPRQCEEEGDPPAYFRSLLWTLLHETRDEPMKTRMMWLPRNLQYGWGVPSLGGLPAEMVRRALRWIGRRWSSRVTHRLLRKKRTARRQLDERSEERSAQ